MERLLEEIKLLFLSKETKKATILISVLFSNTKDPLKSLETLYDLSKSLISKSYITQAITLLNSLKTFSLTNHKISLLTDIKNLLSYCFRVRKKFDEALIEVKGSIDICRSKNELTHRLPILYLNVSAIYREDLSNLILSKKYATLAYEQCLKTKDSAFDSEVMKKNLGICMLTLGQLEEALNNKESAVIWYSKGIELDIPPDLLGLFKTRLYNISFVKGMKKPSSRDLFKINPGRRISSRVYSKRDSESLNSSMGSQYSGKHQILFNRYAASP